MASNQNRAKLRLIAPCKVSDEQLLECWTRGMDTYDIVIKYGVPESRVYNRLSYVRARACR